MSDADNYRTLLLALTNHWWDGTYSWWCRTSAGGPRRATREEAMQDLIKWAERQVKEEAGREAVARLMRESGQQWRIPLTVVEVT